MTNLRANIQIGKSEITLRSNDCGFIIALTGEGSTRIVGSGRPNPRHAVREFLIKCEQVANRQGLEFYACHKCEETFCELSMINGVLCCPCGSEDWGYIMPAQRDEPLRTLFQNFKSIVNRTV